jgi:hypothetical protein
MVLAETVMGQFGCQEGINLLFQHDKNLAFKINGITTHPKPYNTNYWQQLEQQELAFISCENTK